MKKINMVRLAGFTLAMVLMLSSASTALAKNDKNKGDKNDDNNGRNSSSFCEKFSDKRWGGPKWCRDNGNDSTRKPLVYLYATDYSIKNGTSTTMYWDALRADSCTVSGKGWSGSRPTSSRENVSPTKTTKYTITCTNQYGSYKDSATITVKGKKPGVTPPATTTPALSFVASSTQIAYGSSTILAWNSTNTNSCVASNGWSGTKSVSGNQTISPTATTTYTLACGNGSATSTQSVTVNVSTSTVVTPPAPSGHLLLSEVNFLTSTLGEWVEIYNGTGASVTMDGWTISDSSSSDTIATTTIPNGGFVIITGSTTLAASLPGVTVVTLGNTTIGSALNDGGDAVYLKDQNGTTIDSMSYGTNSDVFAGVPITGGGVIKRTQLTSDTNTAADWATSTPATPGS